MALIDFNENELFKVYPDILDILLLDFTTKRNIIWGSDNYRKRGPGYYEKDYIKPELITGKYINIIKPRVLKNKTEQIKRSKENAEVFTPSWVCNKQNNLIDSQWFGYQEHFNVETLNGWKTLEKVEFKNGKLWTHYVEDIRLEIACGEAPYIVSRYDTVTGEEIKLKDRIGLLDRKFRVINENAQTNEEWLSYSIKAIQSVYGFDFQGDNLLIARENIFLTYIDNYKYWFSRLPDEELLKQIATIISWNFWQMDGIKMVVPFTCHKEQFVQLNLFDEVKPEFCKGCRNGNVKDHNGKRCIIMDWQCNKKIQFIDLMWRY